MKEFITKEKDYTGCNPYIAELLKKDLIVECWVSNVEKKPF